MKKIDFKELKEIIQSGHINLLIGSGCSLDYLDTLKNIEELMNDPATREEAKKKYYKLIKKSKSILDETRETDTNEIRNLKASKLNYDTFLEFWVNTISNRALHIVNKQINLFTTNFDMFIEDSCERMRIPYNDGFDGQIQPFFDVSNFNKIQRYKSLQFDNTSDIPLINIIKLHGSLSWLANDEIINYSLGNHIDDDLENKRGARFIQGYEKIAIINPNIEKHIKTVLDINYASMLRKFSLELEKENSVLFIFGCSLADKHVKDLLYGVMKTNPTLVVLFFSFSPYNEVLDQLDEKKYSNLFIIHPELNISRITKYFGDGHEADWECFIKDKNASHLEFVDDIKTKIDELRNTEPSELELKRKINQVFHFPFSQATNYLSMIFDKSSNSN